MINIVAIVGILGYTIYQFDRLRKEMAAIQNGLVMLIVLHQMIAELPDEKEEKK